MQRTKPFPLTLLVALFIAAVMAIAAIFVIRQADKSRSNLPILGIVPEFQLTDQNLHVFSAAQFLNHVSVVDFIFTRCQGICPVMADRYTKLHNRFQSTPQFQLISISVDPEYDTPEILTQYPAQHGVRDGRWLLLHGSQDDVKRLCENGFLLPAQDLPQGHSGKFVLVDAQGRIRGYYDHDSDSDQALLQTHLRSLLK